MDPIFETAHAKINLALHVTGQRADGYHLLDSLVTFAEDGDELRFAHADTDSLTVDGLFAKDLPQDPVGLRGNLVIRAREALRMQLAATGQNFGPVAIHLQKNLPVASGIGGGSADAAATLRGLARLWDAKISGADLAQIALSLGADVPMCLQSRPLRAGGIGEAIHAQPIPSMPLLLVNPMKPVSTPEIFRRLARRDNAPIGMVGTDQDASGWLAALRTMRNDLQEPAETLVPEITEACQFLRESLAGLSRMSGSGATCFGLYETDAAALRAALAISAYRPGWYVLLTRSLAGAPQ